MTVALTQLGSDATRRFIEIEYSAVFSGNYVAGGDPIDFSAATRSIGAGTSRIPQGAPDAIDIIGNPGGNPAEPVIGTTNANSKIKLFSAANTEVAAAGYNAAISGDTNIRIRARWKKGRA
jgi:hypothetical protein